MIGNANTLLPERPAPYTGEPYAIPSCWEGKPSFWRSMIDAWIERGWIEPADEAPISADWLCQRHGPARTGTPLSLDAPYPEGHPLAGRTD